MIQTEVVTRDAFEMHGGNSASWLTTCDRIVENASLYQVEIEYNIWDYTTWAFVEAVSLKATQNPFCLCLCTIKNVIKYVLVIFLA